MNDLKVTSGHVMNYLVITFIAGIGGRISLTSMQFLLKGIIDVKSSVLMAVIGVLLLIFAATLGTAVVVGFASRNHIADQYMESADKYIWLKSCVQYILPGELAKFIVNIITIKITHFGSFFNIISYLLYEQVFYVNSPRFQEIFIDEHIQFIDVIAYIGVQLLSLIPVIPAIIFTYWLLWKKREREYQDIKKTWRD